MHRFAIVRDTSIQLTIFSGEKLCHLIHLGKAGDWITCCTHSFAEDLLLFQPKNSLRRQLIVHWPPRHVRVRLNKEMRPYKFLSSFGVSAVTIDININVYGCHRFEMHVVSYVYMSCFFFWWRILYLLIWWKLCLAGKRSRCWKKRTRREKKGNWCTSLNPFIFNWSRCVLSVMFFRVVELRVDGMLSVWMFDGIMYAACCLKWSACTMAVGCSLSAKTCFIISSCHQRGWQVGVLSGLPHCVRSHLSCSVAFSYPYFPVFFSVSPILRRHLEW